MTVPEKVMELSLVPSPIENVKPVAPFKVSVPSETETVTSAIPVPSLISTSAMEMPGMVKFVSSLTVCAAGTVSVGDSPSKSHRAIL